MMMLAFCLLAAIPAITAGSGSVSSKETKTFHPKPSAWMLKPVAENHSFQMPTPKALSANSDTVYVIHTLYSAAGGVCADTILSRIAYANFHCFATSLTTSMMYSCSSGKTIFFLLTFFSFHHAFCLLFVTSSSFCGAEYICYYYEYSDDVCNTYLNGYEMALGTCKVTDEDDDGYVSDGGAGIVFLSQGLTAQVGLPAPLPGTSVTNR